MEKETFSSIIGKVEKAIKPLNCEINSAVKRYMVGPFSWDESKIPTDNSQQELSVSVVYVKDASKIMLVGEIEKVMVSFGFEISGIFREFKPANKLSGSHQHDEITVFTLNFIRRGELG
jgi:hypothetical protein